MSNVTTDTVGSNEAKKVWMDKFLQLQAHGCFVFCAYFLWNAIPQEKMHFSCMCVYRLPNEYGTCHYCVTVAVKKLILDLNPLVPGVLQLQNRSTDSHQSYVLDVLSS